MYFFEKKNSVVRLTIYRSRHSTSCTTGHVCTHKPRPAHTHRRARTARRTTALPSAIISLASSQSIASPVIKRHHPQSPSSRSAPTLPPLHASSSTAHSTRKQCARASCAPQRVGGGNCSASYTVTVSRPPSSRTTSSVEAEEVGARGRL